jgi:hypothetical protein
MGNIIVTVTHPQLTPEERAKRMAEIKQAAIRLVIETEKAKRQKTRKEQTS